MSDWRGPVVYDSSAQSCGINTTVLDLYERERGGEEGETELSWVGLKPTTTRFLDWCSTN